MSDKKKTSLALAVLFAVNILLITYAQNVEAASYKKGSTGSVVSQIQEVLKSFGCYSGEVDGVFGGGTEAAVKKFQSGNGLTAEGVVGVKTLEALGISAENTADASSTDVDLLARLISAESRGEPYNGQVAVGAVVLNRVEHPSFPNTVSGVIYQSGAFTCLTDGEWEKPVEDNAYKAARDALNGVDPSGGAIYYFNPSTATNKWVWSRPLVVTIGKHRFCN